MRKKLFISLVCVFILASVPLTVHAGVWQEDVRGYWYLNDDGTKPVGSWKIIDNKWYYFKEDETLDGLKYPISGIIVNPLEK